MSTSGPNDGSTFSFHAIFSNSIMNSKVLLFERDKDWLAQMYTLSYSP